ncbi:peptidase MA family metallohydrolase [Chloroflexota bacterium]
MRKPLVLIALILLLVALIPGSVQAQGEISASTTTEIKFPTSLTFHLKASLSPISSAVITKITLRYKINKITTATVVSEVEPEFDPGPVVETSWEWDMRKAGLPTGAEINYRWRIKDALGQVMETPWETVTFDDDRYSWDQLTEDKVSLLWYQGTRGFAQELLDAALEAQEKLARDIGAYLEQPAKIYIYANYDDLQGALVYAQEWTGGRAFTEYGIVVIGVATGNLEWGKRAMVHELAHLVTYQMTFNPYGDMPTWLNEGLSKYAEGDLQSRDQSMLSEAISEDKLISVQSLSSGFPADPEQANLSYVQSYSLVEFLISDYGSERMLQLLGVFKQGAAYDKALEEVYDFDAERLDTLWRASLGLGPRPTPLVVAPTPTPITTSYLPPKAGDGCAAPSTGSSSGVAILGNLSILLVLPTTAEAIHLRSRNRRKECHN